MLRTAVVTVVAGTLIMIGAGAVAGCSTHASPAGTDAMPWGNWTDNIWQTGDITAATGAPPAANGALAGYVFEAQGTQHVIYSSAPDNRLRELWWNINGWHTADLTAATGASPPAAQASLTGYAFETQGTEHVIYTGADAHLHELWSGTTGWHAGDLTAATGAPPPAAQASLTGYAFETQRTQHIVYTGADTHLHELWSDRSIGWHSADLTAATGAPPARGLAGYAFDQQGTEHVVYTAADHHLHELWWSNGWHLGDLTAATGAAIPGSDVLVAYAFEVQGTQHAAYISAGDAHIHELWWGPRVNPAPQSGRSPPPTGTAANPSGTNAPQNLGQAPG